MNFRISRMKWIVALALTALTAMMGPSLIAKDLLPDLTPANDNESSSANGESSEPPTNGQPPAPPSVPDAYESPYATMMTFITSINEAMAGDDDAWETVYRCFEFSSADRDRAKSTARELIEILDRLEEIEAYTPLLGSSADVEVEADAEIFTYFPDNRFAADNPRFYAPAIDAGVIEFKKMPDGRWLFSEKTVETVHDLFLAVEHLSFVESLQSKENENDSVEFWLRRQVPPELKGRIFTVEYWQWIGIAVLILIGLILDQIVRAIIRVITHRIIARVEGQADETTIRKAMRPLGLMATGIFWMLTIQILNLPNDAYIVLLAAARIFTTLATVWAAWSLTDLLAEVLASKAAKTETKIDNVIVPLIQKTIKIFIMVFGLIYIASSLHINVLPLITGLGIGGVAFAFAAKDTIENLFGSVAVIVDRPFEIGDWVVINDVEGTVESIGFRSTRVRTFYNSQVTVPNANLVRANVDNYGRRKYRRWKTNIGVQYDTTPDQLIAFTEGIRELIRTHPYTRKDYFQIWVTGFGSSSIDILLYLFHEVDDWSMELRERERLIIDIVRLADQLGVQFAFPTQTVHLYKEEHAAHEVQHGIPQAMTDRRAAVAGIRAAQKLTANQTWHDQKPGPVPYPEGPTAIDPDDDEQAAIENTRDGA